jgi:hypothetical protein
VTAAQQALVPVAIADRIRAELDAALDPQLHAKRELYANCAALAETIKVTDATSLQTADEFAKDLLRERDELEAVRASGPGALDKIVRALNAKFKPLRDVLDAAVSNLKHERGAYLLAQKKQQEKSYQAAAAAHVTGDHEKAQVALQIASATDTSTPVGTSVREVWVVERYVPEMMVLSTPDHPGLVPDEQAIAAYLRKLPASETPALPGVVCKLMPQVTDRR